MKDSICNAVRERFPLPAHIEACARAIRYDLFHGPSFSRIPADGIEAFTADDFATFHDDLQEDLAAHGGKIEETYTGTVAATLRAFIDDLPSELWVDEQCGATMDSEPEGYEDDETGEYVEPDLSDYYRLESRDIVECLLGKTIAREFN